MAPAHDYSGDLENDEWAAWYRLSMEQRWEETEKLWQYYLSMGGSLAPEPDSQSPFYFEGDEEDVSAVNQPDMNAVWRDLIRTRIAKAILS